MESENGRSDSRTKEVVHLVLCPSNCLLTLDRNLFPPPKNRMR